MEIIQALTKFLAMNVQWFFLSIFKNSAVKKKIPYNLFYRKTNISTPGSDDFVSFGSHFVRSDF